MNWSTPKLDAFNADIPIFLGIAIFAMEGINQVLFIEDSMTPQAQKKFPLALGMSVGFVTMLLAGFGVTCWAFYGASTSSSISLNLPTDFGGRTARIVLCLYLMLTYPFQMYPLTQAFDKLILTSGKDQGAPVCCGIPSKGFSKWLTIIMVRLVLVAGTAVLAITIPKFGPFLSLIGFLAFGIMGFVAPSAIALHVHNVHAKHAKQNMDPALAKKVKTFRFPVEQCFIVCVAILGCCVSIFGTIMSVRSIMAGDDEGGHGRR